jgi:two-component system, LuxR family, sensor kinase FixL
VVQVDTELLESMASVGMQLGRVIERKAFQDRLLTLSEEEHRRIGQELHDDVGQELAGLALKVETLKDILAAEETPAADLARDLVVVVDRICAKTLALSRGMIPKEIDAPGLEAALDGLARQVDAAGTVSCRFQRTGDRRVRDSQTATQLFRIAQEAVANALRHAEAERMEIALSCDENATVLTIDDDGVGIGHAHPGGAGMGLSIMRYRAGLIGARLSFVASRGGGTRVTCRIPTGTR